MFKLIIGNRAYSSWSMRGWLACKQSGEEFEELVVPMFDAEWDQRREGDEFAPSLGKVPILWDGECVVWDSLAIVEFLADRVGRDAIWPDDDGARGMARSMAAEMHSGFANLRRELPMNVRKSYSPIELSDDVARGDRPDPPAVGAGPRAVRRDRRLPVRRLVRGGHDVCAGRDPLHHLRRRRARLRRRLHEGGAVAAARRRMDRQGPGRAVGDRAI